MQISIVNHHLLRHCIVMMKSVFDEQCKSYYHVIIEAMARRRRRRRRLTIMVVMMMFIHLFHLHLSFILHYHSKTIMLNLQVIRLISSFGFLSFYDMSRS